MEAIDDDIISNYGKIFEKGDFIIKEGENSKDIYLILTGRVIVVKEINTIKKVLAVLGPGEIIGEMSQDITGRIDDTAISGNLTGIVIGYSVFKFAFI